MNISKFSPPERLIFDVQGLIAEIKNQYFSTSDNTPLDDNDTLVHKLCVRLENILRYGLREKYSFLGVKKDYWNYILDSLSKDEIVKFVTSIQELKTNQGKGRALLRQALMEKCLADTLQRCAIDGKQTREYYLTDSIFRNHSMLQTLVHSLYDLNAIDFQLPHRGYDLDRSFPSFSRKTFGNESNRKESISQSKEDDPVIILSGHIINLASLLNSWYTDETIMTDEESLTLKENIDKVKKITHVVDKLREKSYMETEQLTTDLNRIKEDKLKSNAEYELRLKQLNDRYMSLQNLDITATEEKMKGLYDKLVATEVELTECKAKLQASAKDNEIVSVKLDGIENRNMALSHEQENLSQVIEEQKIEIERMKKIINCNDSTNKILESKLSEIQRVNIELKGKENESTSKIISLDSQLKVRDEELETLKNAFQQSTGVVLGSFKEFKDELNSQLLEKSDDIKNMSIQNQSLVDETKSLVSRNTELEQKLEEMEQKLRTESKKREEAERVVLEQKQKLAGEMKYESLLKNCMRDIWACLLSDENELALDNITDSSAVELKQEKFIKKLNTLKSEYDELKNSIVNYESDMVELRLQLDEKTVEYTKMKESFEENNKELIEVKKDFQALENEHELLVGKNLESENEIISSLMAQLSRLNDELSTKQESLEHMEKNLVEVEMEMSKIKLLYEALASEKESRLAEIGKLHEVISELQDDLNKEQKGNESASLTMENIQAKEASYKNEMKVLKGEIESIANIKNQELQSLKFEISSLEMKYETAANDTKILQEKQQKLLGDIQEKENTIIGLEQNASDRTATFRSEKEAVEQQNEQLKKKLETTEEKMKVSEKEISFLKLQVAKVAKEKEEEKANRINTLKKLHNTVEEKKKIASTYEEKIKQLEEDIKELKDHLVRVTQDKHDLWQKKDSLEFEIRQKKEERWVSDGQVKQCTSCLADFSFTVRRHHCRLCGHIFCSSCANQWLKTAHSRKKIRSCRACAKTFHEKHGDKEVDDETLATISDTISINSHNESLDQNDQNDFDSMPANFEVLDSSNITKSGSFGPSEHISITADDEIREVVIPTPIVLREEDDDEHDITDERERFELTLYAGKRCFIPVVVASKLYELSWEFTSAPKDVGFGIAFKTTEEESDDNLQTFVPFSRYMSHQNSIHGKMTIDDPGIYYLCFSNSFSRFTSKTVECYVSLRKGIINALVEGESGDGTEN